MARVDLDERGQYIIDSNGSIKGGHNADEFERALDDPLGKKDASGNSIGAYVITRTPVYYSIGNDTVF